MKNAKATIANEFDAEIDTADIDFEEIEAEEDFNLDFASEIDCLFD